MPSLIRVLIRLVLGVWFRRVEVVDDGGVPLDGPRILIANHENGLIDPLLIAGALPVAPRFLAKSTLWRNPLLALLFALGRVIPVHRRQDAAEGARPEENAAMFRIAGEVLARGGTIAIFPEGQSHNAPQLQPLKTGAARLALAAPPEVRIVPVGIVFTEKERFRSRALLVVGRALDTAAERRLADQDPPGAVRALTARMAEALAAVTINAESWHDRRLLARAAELSAPARSSLEVRHRRMAELLAGYRWLAAERPQEVSAVRAAVERYDRALEAFGASDAEVTARFGGLAVLAWLGRLSALALVRTPIGVAGALLNLVPYRLVDWLAARKAAQPDEPASWKLFGALVFYPAWWALLALGAGWTGGPVLAACAPIVAALSGYIAVRWLERLGTLAGQARLAWRLSAQRPALEQLRAERRLVGELLARLEAEWRAARG